MTELIVSAMDSKVELLADGISYAGIVENISKKGLYMIVNREYPQL